MFAFAACSTEHEDPAPRPDAQQPQTQSSSPTTEGSFSFSENGLSPQISMDPDAPLTLADFQNDTLITLYAVPSGYTLEKEGEVNYSSAYLIVPASQTLSYALTNHTVSELYVFDDQDDYDGMYECDREWSTSFKEIAGQTVEITSCELAGTDCTVESSANGLCLSRCMTA